ncbi:MAG: hypothetical protein JJV97_06125 [SAR324 cluster bacterium]|nr:hypothetical protein [SAR324 cluster bacterium]
MDSLIFYFKQGLREIKHKKKFTIFFVFNLSVGMVGLLLISSFNQTINNFLDDNLRTQLTSDMEVISKQPFSENQLSILSQAIGDEATSTESISLVTMARNDSGAKKRIKIVELFVIDDKYPLVGTIELEKQDKVDDISYQQLSNPNRAWIAKEVAAFLALDIGDTFKLGNQEITVDDIIKQEPLTSSVGFTPKVYLSYQSALNTGLLRKTTRIQYIRRYAFTDYRLAPEIKKTIDALLNKANHDDKAVNVRTYKEASNTILSLTRIVSSYLTLMAMMAFMLSALGTMYLYRHYFNKKRIDFAVLRILGLTNQQVRLVFGAQMFLISLLAVIGTLILGYISVYFINIFLAKSETINLVLSIDALSIGKICLVSFLGLPIFCLPSLLKLGNIKLSDLFSEISTASEDNINFGKAVSYWNIFKGSLVYLVIIVFLGVVTILISVSFTSLIFFGLLVAIFSLFSIIAQLLIKLLQLIISRSSWHHNKNSFKHALLLISRYSTSSVQCFVAVGVSSFLLFFIPELYDGIKKEVLTPKSSDTPQFFLFDIQAEQTTDLTKFITQQPAKLDNLSPMVRGRWLDVNGIKLLEWSKQIEKKTTFNPGHDEKRRADLRMGVYNLSYKGDWNSSEKIISGDAKWGRYDGVGLPKISVESRFAKRNNLNIGDVLTFKISGDLIKGKIANIRGVRWNDFLPNFFIIFQSGVLEDYPQTNLANVSGIGDHNVADFSYRFADNFSNIPLIDIRSIIASLLDLSYKIMLFILLLGVMGFITGLISLYGIMLAESDRQKLIYNLFKVLGIGQGQIWGLALGQYLGIILPGVTISMAMAYFSYSLIGWAIFDSNWVIDPLSALINWLILSCCTIGWMVLSTYRAILSSPAKIFNQGLS